ncbi:hypothetical protein S40293_07743 [Stachybotrys chartarum IBT 40293]|nr:hypothetical protein S40293_07743 [Stachybotrys chartarum IBT 40293]
MEEQEQLSLASTFPNPPPFWRDFTPDRISRIEKLRKAHVEQSQTQDSQRGSAVDEKTLRIPDIPDDLITLQPPAEPSDGRWRVFGDQYMLDDKLPTLEEQGITNLIPPSATSPPSPTEAKSQTHYDRALELKRLAKSLLLNFLELTGTMSRNPSRADAKVADLRTLFINMHHIINEYRPHQARESAIELMQDHLNRTRDETVAIRTQVERARVVLEGLGSLTISEDGVAAAKGEREGREGEDERREWELWMAADAVVG